MLTSNKLIISACFGTPLSVALGLIAVFARGQGLPLGSLFLVLAMLALGALVVVLASGVVLAVRGFYRHPEQRTRSNLIIAVAGLIAFALVLYLLMSTINQKAAL
jgi:hypothetical protein